MEGGEELTEVLLITGAARGIGAATARLAAARGYAVCVNYLRDKTAADTLVAEIEAAGGRALAVQGDVASEVEVERLFNRVIEVNVLGVFYCTRAAVRRMSTRHGGAGGAIVNLSSGAATLGSPGEYVWYAASKGAVDSFTLGLAKEIAGEGIRVNAVAPGMVATEIHAASGDAGRLDRIGRSVPIGRYAEPEEIAEAALWLLSPAASYVTGTILRAAGGR
jgi:NAD(P)-dependent dehydrogenase (short-subunit alcohol dehydrogenase family)